MSVNKVKGCLFGMALGDALGADTEFLNYDGIRARFPPNGPQELRGNPARVTDDTQMAIAVGDALLAVSPPYSPTSLAVELKKTFIAWYDSPENDRAPGNTCLSSIENLMDGQDWHEATAISSKGCGANMRVQPVGLLDVDDVTRAKISQFQAALTHGHPTGLASADITAFVIAELYKGSDPYSLPKRCRDYAQSQRRVYHDDWLGDLWQRAMIMPTAEDYIAHGWDEVLGVLDKLDEAFRQMDKLSDPCLATGAGWIAEEAFATALFCFLMYPDDTLAVIRRAVFTSGDSDSIACIAGAFAGVYNGFDALPADWVERIEYKAQLEKLADGLRGTTTR